MRAKVLLAGLLVLVAAVAVPGGAVPPGERSPCRPGDAFVNDEVRIWFQGHKAHWQVHDNDGQNASSYDVKTRAIVELDADGDEVASMHIGRAFPFGSTCEVVETDAFVNMTITITEQVVRAQGNKDLGGANVTYAVHFNKTSNGAKFDLFVEDWPWQAEGSLAFDFTAHADNLTIETASNGLGFREGSGDSFGFLTWADNFNVTYADGSGDEGNVTPDVENDGTSAAVRLHFTNVSAGYTDLVYDPFMGVGDYIILLGQLIPLDALLPEELVDLVGGLV